MVQKVDLIIENNSIEVSSMSENILSKVYFRIGEKIFPDEGWSDFTVIILGWWIEELAKLEIGSKTFLLSFMDGPLHVKGFLKGNNTVELVFTRERQNKDEVIFPAVCDIGQLKVAIYKAAKELIDELEKRGVDNKDVIKLKLLMTTNY
ncbi:MAG: hypothetical protein ACERKN_22225 [Velocimicrobium sp.]